jgi:Ca2+-binding RTX toxin-like protein
MGYNESVMLAIFLGLFIVLGLYYFSDQEVNGKNITIPTNMDNSNSKSNVIFSVSNQTEQKLLNTTNSIELKSLSNLSGEPDRTDEGAKTLNQKEAEKKTKGNLNADAGLQITSLIPKTCLATSNPCYGTDQDDRMSGDGGPNLIYSKKGNDQILGDSGNDELYGEEGDDMFWGLIGDDRIIGGDGKDVLYGGTGHDILDGGPGNNIFEGGQGNDNIYGANGSDQIQGGPGADYIISGEGDDIIWHGYGGATDQPDGSKDVVDCGPGIDKAWINNEEGDEAHDCELVNGQATSSGLHP